MLNKNEEYVRVFKVALNSVGINANLCTADLISSVVSMVAEKGDDATLKDSIKLMTDHEKAWEDKKED